MARKRRPVEEDNPLRWLTTYGDVVTLLLAFFVMLYAISKVDEQKFLLFVAGLQDPFGNQAITQGLLAQGTGIVGGAYGEAPTGENTGFEGEALLDGLPELERSIDEGEVDPEDVQEYLTSLEDLIEVRDAVRQALQDAGFAESVDFELGTRGLVIAVATDDVLFASGSAQFGDRGRDIVAAIAPSLAGFDNEILVEGHTDSVPLLGHPGYDNWNLSADRALAVLKLLVDEFGIAPDRLAATGYGEYRPRASNDTEAGRAKNRRVELVVVADVDRFADVNGGDGNGG
ncbi:MAG TPA: hypothetical protein ENK55_08790 [Actinobacteria bacterium]|nr:hypothetical protein [Actinomycetota bacterium]